MISILEFNGLSLGLALLGLLGATAIILAFIFVKACRSHPAEIILIIAVGDFFQVLALIAF